MPQLPKELLLSEVLNAIQICGWQPLILNSQHPFRIRAVQGEDHLDLLLYVFTMTHGGGKARPSDEYRIQITGISPPLQISGEYITLLLGWHEDLGVFGGFDVRRHQHFSTRSPSIQIKLGTLESAKKYGISFQRKENREIVAAFDPFFLMNYVQNQQNIHEFGDTEPNFNILTEASRGHQIPREDIENFPEERQRIIRQMTLAHRDVSFRRRVLTAYESRCAICEIQLNLVVAAHIIPVKLPGSTDSTSNGITLCFLHHEAYDRALLGIDPHYKVLLNELMMHDLNLKRLGGGSESFIQVIGRQIFLPRRQSDRPKPEYLRRGLEVRGFPTLLA